MSFGRPACAQPPREVRRLHARSPSQTKRRNEPVQWKTKTSTRRSRHIVETKTLVFRERAESIIRCEWAWPFAFFLSVLVFWAPATKRQSFVRATIAWLAARSLPCSWGQRPIIGFVWVSKVIWRVAVQRLGDPSMGRERWNCCTPEGITPKVVRKQISTHDNVGGSFPGRRARRLARSKANAIPGEVQEAKSLLLDSRETFPIRALNSDEVQKNTDSPADLGSVVRTESKKEYLHGVRSRANGSPPIEWN